MKKKHNISGAATGHGVDTQQVDQADEEVRDIFFAMIESVCALEHARDPVAFPWKKHSEAPPDHIYNMDEMSTDPMKHQSKVLIMAKGLCGRIFQSSQWGDKFAAHASLCVTTRADGGVCYPKHKMEGATPPFIAHCDKPSDKLSGAAAK